MAKMSTLRLVGFVATLSVGIALGNLIGAIMPPTNATVASLPSIDVARAPSFQTIVAPSDSAIELLTEATRVPVPMLQTADAPSPAKKVAPAAPAPKAAPRPRRRVLVRYASRDAEDDE